MLGAALFNKACLAAGTRQSMCIDRGHDRLLALSNQFQLNGTMFAMEEKQLRVIDTTEPTNCPFIVQRVSPQISLYDSASGKILLAYLSEKERAEYLERMPMTPFQKSFEDKQKNFDVELYRIRKMDIQKNTTLFLPEYQRCQCRSLTDIIMNCLEV
mgnify:CR=1 FL=1